MLFERWECRNASKLLRETVLSRRTGYNKRLPQMVKTRRIACSRPFEQNIGHTENAKHRFCFVVQNYQSTKSGLRQRIAKKWRRQISGQSFSDQQKQTLSGFSGLNYSPTHSIAFLRWLGEQKRKWVFSAWAYPLRCRKGVWVRGQLQSRAKYGD